ncbi:MAG: SemiSWEET family transporter [bacterium]|nr:SemiSWEET family transporter [bacterium]
MTLITIIGLVAATLTAAAGFPQVIKSWKTKSTKDLSLFMVLQILIGITLWTVYGLAKKDIALLYGQAVGYISYISLLILKIKYK